MTSFRLVLLRTLKGGSVTIVSTRGDSLQKYGHNDGASEFSPFNFNIKMGLHFLRKMYGYSRALSLGHANGFFKQRRIIFCLHF
jgi:hypothetical protein